MLMDRIIKALTFKKEVYAEVEQDTSFTPTAWMIVAVVAVLSSLSNLAVYDTISGGLVAALITSAFAIGGFAVAAWVMSAVGKAMFSADVNFDEMVRTLGLAYVWNVIGFLGILGFFPVLLCLTAPVQFAAWIMSLISWYFAAQESLDLETGPTVVVLVIGWVATVVAGMIAGGVIGMFGLAASAAAGAFGG